MRVKELKYKLFQKIFSFIKDDKLYLYKSNSKNKYALVGNKIAYFLMGFKSMISVQCNF